MTQPTAFPLLELLRKALWSAHRFPDMGTPEVRLSQASPQLTERIERYQLQSLFSAAFGYPLRLESDPSRTNADVADTLVDFLPRFSAQLTTRGITALPLGATATLNFYRTGHNALLLEGGVDLLVAPACLPALRQLLTADDFTEQSAERASAPLTFVRGALSIRLHTRSARFYSRTGRLRYQQLETAYRQSDSLGHQSIGNSRWAAFPPLFLIIHLTARIQQELFAGRPLMRSLCDWLMTIHGERTALGIAETNLEIRLRELHLYHLYRTLGCIAQTQFGLERNSYALLSRFSDAELRQGQWLWTAFVDRRIPKCRPGLTYRDGLTFLRKVKCWMQLSARCTQLRSLCGREASAAPWVWLLHPEWR
jgi:hypothetical protein